MHPAEHRGLRELFATARQLAQHWDSLADRLGIEALREGALDAHQLLRELRPLAAARGLYSRPAAQGVGFGLAGARRQVGDRFLERNQALRTAVLDVAHVETLVAYLEGLARKRGDGELARLFEVWGARLRDHERAARRAVIALSNDPDGAIAPLDPSPAGRAAHGVQLAVGTVGEWVDGKLKR